MAALAARAERIDHEIEQETRRIQQRFADPQPRLFPVALPISSQRSWLTNANHIDIGRDIDYGRVSSSTTRRMALTPRQVSGPFLSLPVLLEAFPNGLDKKTHEGDAAAACAWPMRSGPARRNTKASDASALHAAWVQLVLGELLEFDDKTLRMGDGLPSGLDVALAEHHERLRPSMAIVEPSGRAKAGVPRLLVAVLPSGQDLESAVPAARWRRRRSST